MTTLKIKIDDRKEDVDAEAFLAIIQNTLRLLKAINQATFARGADNVRWRISEASKSSPISTTLVGEPGLPEKPDESPYVVRAFIGGLRHLERSSTCPPNYNQQSLGLVRQFLASRAAGITGITFSSNGEVAEVTDAVSRNAAWAMQRLAAEPGQFVDFGTIEGFLATLNAKQGMRLEIQDGLTGEYIPCYFADPEVEAQARKTWAHRAAVSGEMRVDAQTGKVTSIKVSAIEQLPSSSEFPGEFEAIDITGSVESSEYVRKLRDESYPVG